MAENGIPGAVVGPKLRKRRLVLAFSIIGVVLVVVAITSVLSIMNGGVPRYKASHLVRQAQSTMSVLVDKDWELHGVGTWRDPVKDEKQTGYIAQTQLAYEAFTGEAAGLTASDVLEEYQDPAKVSDFFTGFSVSTCHAKSGETTPKTIEVSGKQGIQWGIECPGDHAIYAASHGVLQIIADDFGMYMLYAAAVEDIWNKNTDYFDQVVKSLEIT